MGLLRVQGFRVVGCSSFRALMASISLSEVTVVRTRSARGSDDIVESSDCADQFEKVCTSRRNCRADVCMSSIGSASSSMTLLMLAARKLRSCMYED